jgi:hypothetical protein
LRSHWNVKEFRNSWTKVSFLEMSSLARTIESKFISCSLSRYESIFLTYEKFSSIALTYPHVLEQAGVVVVDEAHVVADSSLARHAGGEEQRPGDRSRAGAGAPGPGHRSDGGPKTEPGKVRSEKGRINASEEEAEKSLMAEEKKQTQCPCNHGWVCEDHPDKPWEHDGCGRAGDWCQNPDCDKDPDSIFVEMCCSAEREE